VEGNGQAGGHIMSEFRDRIQANMDVTLEQVCRELPNGGCHEERKYIAERMIECARGGGTTLGELDAVARRALLNLTQKRSA
jgi:hypothetical protein